MVSPVCFWELEAHHRTDGRTEMPVQQETPWLLLSFPRYHAIIRKCDQLTIPLDPKTSTSFKVPLEYLSAQQSLIPNNRAFSNPTSRTLDFKNITVRTHLAFVTNSPLRDLAEFDLTAAVAASLVVAAR